MSLIDAIHRSLSNRGFKSTQPQSPKFKPSVLGSPCLRKIYYSYNRVLEDFASPIALQKYGDMGDAAGERLARNLRDAGILIDYYDKEGKTPIRFGKPNKEFPLKDIELEISAMIDAVVILENKLWLGEFKTIGKRPFDGLFKPKNDHLIQGSTYLYLFNKALKDGHYSHIKELSRFEKVEGIRFLYECRDNGDMKEFPITEADEVFRQTIAKIFTIKEHTKDGTLPPMTPDWCKSCPYRIKCKNGYKV